LFVIHYEEEGSVAKPEFREKRLHLPCRKWCGDPLALGALPYSADGIPFHPAVTDSMTAHRACDIPDLDFGASAPLNRGQPLLNENCRSILNPL
jgi:hypothetical protein